MVNLVIDIGNTFTKIAIFDNRQLTGVQVMETENAAGLDELVNATVAENAIVSTVDREIADLEGLLRSKYKYIRFHGEMELGINNKYKTPKTLGLDRLAAVIGAEALNPGKNVLVIDAGTCITYDLIDQHKDYYGGSISPGLNMRFNAVHTFTGRLPKVEFDKDFTALYGYDTRSSLLSGIQNGTYNEVLGFVQTYSGEYQGLQVLLCGGDAAYFESRLKSSIFADSVKSEPNVVLIGLNEVIYHYND